MFKLSFITNLLIPHDFFILALEISRQERWRRLREELAEKGREAEIETLLENLVDAIQDSKDKLCIAEDEVRAGTPSDTGTEDSFEDYVRFYCVDLIRERKKDRN